MVRTFLWRNGGSRLASTFARNSSKGGRRTGGGGGGGAGGGGYFSSAYVGGAITVAATTLVGATSLLRDDHDDEVATTCERNGTSSFLASATGTSMNDNFNDDRLSLLAAAGPSSLFSTPATASCEGVGFIGRITGLFGGGGDQEYRSADGRNGNDATLESRYNVDWDNPIGEGTFGSVYKAKDKNTGETVAVKKITRKAEGDEEFQRELDALMYLKEHGGHPNICGMRAKYEQGEYFYLVLDYISGGEMFDHLSTHGPYSEADAARLIREVASSLAFLHGLNVVHGDLKPENREFAMMSQVRSLNYRSIFTPGVPRLCTHRSSLFASSL